MAGEKHPLQVEGRVVDITNPGKVLYPKSGTTKAQVIDYHIQVAPVLLPHMRDRPVSIKRYPDGVEAGYFFQKEAPSNKPAWMKTFPVPSDRKGHINYLLCNDLPSLVWLANAADLELHTFMHRVPKVGQPTMMVFDLDPGAPADLVDCCDVALALRVLLDDLGLQSWPNVSGGKGLHVRVPVAGEGGYPRTKQLARAIAELLREQLPERVVTVMVRERRHGRVFIDWSQNDPWKSIVALYSARGLSHPTVAAPVTWDEVDRAADGAPLSFEAADVLDRIEALGDLWAPTAELEQEIPKPKA